MAVLDGFWSTVERTGTGTGRNGTGTGKTSNDHFQTATGNLPFIPVHFRTGKTLKPGRNGSKRYVPFVTVAFRQSRL